MKNFKFKKFISVVTSIAMIASAFVYFPFHADAASVTSLTAVFGRIKASTNADSVVVTFASPTGIQTGGADTITLTFSADFTLAAESVNNFDIGLGDSGTCSSASYTDETIATAPSATEWGIDVTGNVLTLSPETDDTLTAGFCIKVEMGTAATTGATGSASTVANGAADDDDTIVIGGAFGDSGTASIDIVSDDQVTVSATVDSTLSFDIDTSTDATESNTPYTVAFGTLSSGSVTSSGTTDSINLIVLEGSTNATGGMAVTVKNANGSSGLVSTSTPADTIDNSAATMAAGTENYGLCVDTVNLSGFSRAGNYNAGTCVVDGDTNAVKGLTTTPGTMVSTTAPVANAHAEVVASATISGLTVAHNDYADTLTFIATGTF